MAFEIIQIPKDDESIRRYVEQVKAFRLYSLQTSPSSFLSTYARENAFTDDVWYQRLRNPQAITFVAIQADRIVSSIAVIGPLPFSPDELSPLGNPWVSIDGSEAVKTPTNSHWRINGMFTLPEARGQGIAKALIDAAKEFGGIQAEEAGKDVVLSIAVDEDNVAAKSLYSSCGFVTITEAINRDDSRNVLLMAWQPSPS